MFPCGCLGFPIQFLRVSVRVCVCGFLLLPVFVGFSMGICSFAFLTWYFMGEGINTKTMVSLALAFALICVQLLWK